MAAFFNGNDARDSRQLLKLSEVNVAEDVEVSYVVTVAFPTSCFEGGLAKRILCFTRSALQHAASTLLAVDRLFAWTFLLLVPR